NPSNGTPRRYPELQALALRPDPDGWRSLPVSPMFPSLLPARIVSPLLWVRCSCNQIGLPWLPLPEPAAQIHPAELIFRFLRCHADAPRAGLPAPISASEARVPQRGRQKSERSGDRVSA